jgi:hypothetical protein
VRSLLLWLLILAQPVYGASSVSLRLLGPAHADKPLDVPALPLCAPLPPTSARTALQVQRLLTLNAAVAASRNRLLPACGSASAKARLRLLADAVHVGLKRLAPGDECWEVWLQPGLMEALVAWRESLTDRAWAHMSWAAGQLAGGHPVNRRELAPWQLATRGYLPSTASFDVTTVVAL